MKRLLIVSAIATATLGIPATAALAHSGSDDRSPAPSTSRTDDRTAPSTHATPVASATATRSAEPGDDRGAAHSTESHHSATSTAVDDHGGLRTTAEPGDDNGGARPVGTSDDPATDDHGGNSGRGSGSGDGRSDSDSGSGSHGGGGDDGSNHR